MQFREAWAVVSDMDGYLSDIRIGMMLDQNRILYLAGKPGVMPLCVCPNHELAREEKRVLVREKKEKGDQDGSQSENTAV